MGRVSVPLWGAFLSEPLPIVALVGRHPANQLIGREPIRRRRNFQYNAMKHRIPSGISRRFHRLSPGNGHVAHALRTLPPVAGISIATHPLPLDLHVLSLPLAFILSQDQTLLCIIHLFPVRPRQLHSSKKKNQRSHFVLGTCCTSFSLFNELVCIPVQIVCVSFRTGMQR